MNGSFNDNCSLTTVVSPLDAGGRQGWEPAGVTATPCLVRRTLWQCLLPISLSVVPVLVCTQQSSCVASN